MMTPQQLDALCIYCKAAIRYEILFAIDESKIDWHERNDHLAELVTAAHARDAARNLLELAFKEKEK